MIALRGLLLVLLGALLLPAQYGTGGPAILSRSGVLGQTSTERQALFGIQPWLSANGSYDSGYQAIRLDQNGNARPVDAFSGGVSAGVRGWHNWRRTLFGVNYLANVRHYPDQPGIDGVDQMLTIGIGHQFTRRLSMSLNEMAGWFGRSAGLWNPGFYADPILGTAPTSEIFDTKVRFMSTTGSLTYVPTTRWSFGITGMGSVVRRSSSSFAGLNSWGALGDAGYRLSRNKTVGFFYSYQHYDFTRVFGATDVNQIGMEYSQSVGRNWKFSLLAGAARSESQFTRQVQLAPDVAAILGVGTGVEAFHGVNYGAVYRVNIERNFRRSSFGLTGGQGITPGNGYYLTSRTQFATATYSYTAFRATSISLFASYQNMSSLTKSLEKYESFYEGVSLSRKLVGFLHGGCSFYHRHQLAGNTAFKRDSYTATVFLSVTPGAIPISLW